jgi:hypothetical protein
MILFTLGLMLGCCLGVFFIALLARFKKADEAIFRFMEERDAVDQEYVPLTRRSAI